MTTRNHTTFDPAAVAAQLTLEQSGTVVSTSAANISASAHALYEKQAGLWYVEWVPFGEMLAGGNARVGLCQPASSTAQKVGTATNDVGYDSGGSIYKGGSVFASATAWGVGDVIGMLVDLAFGAVIFYVNRTPVGAAPLALSTDYVPASSLSQGVPDPGITAPALAMLLSAGQREFESTPAIGAVNAGWFDLTPGIGMLRIADRAWMTAPTDTPPNTPYDDALGSRGLVLTDSLNFWPWAGSKSGGSRATLELHNADGDYDYLLEQDARDANVVLRMGDTETALDTATTVARLLVDSVQANDDGRLSVSARDRSVRLQRTLQRRLVLPTADEAAANQPWPWGVGAVRSAEVVSLSSADLRYALNDGPVAGLGAVRDRGAVFDPSAGDFTLDQATGTLTMAREAQGRVTADFSTIGGSLPPTPTDDLGGIGNPFASASWAFKTNGASPGWAINSGELWWTQSNYNGYGLVSARTTTDEFTAGRMYKVVLNISLLRDRSWSSRGQPPPNMAYITIGSNVGNGYGAGWDPDVIDPASCFGRIYPVDAIGSAVGEVSVIGMAVRTGPMHIGLNTGAEGAAVTIDSVVAYELDATDADDDTLEPSTLQHALRQLLEVKGDLLPSDWSAADAAAIDTATGYAGIGYQAPSAETPTIAQARAEMLASSGADYCVDDDGGLRFVRLVDPAGETSTATITASMLLADPQVSTDTAPGLTTQLQGRKNWAPLDPSEMVSDDLGLPYNLTGGDI